jgi:hypothetical protein
MQPKKETGKSSNIKTYIATPSPQSTNFTTKLTAGIHPAAHSFFSMMILHSPSTDAIEVKRAKINGLRRFIVDNVLQGKLTTNEGT